MLYKSYRVHTKCISLDIKVCVYANSISGRLACALFRCLAVRSWRTSPHVGWISTSKAIMYFISTKRTVTGEGMPARRGSWEVPLSTVKSSSDPDFLLLVSLLCLRKGLCQDQGLMRVFVSFLELSFCTPGCLSHGLGWGTQWWRLLWGAKRELVPTVNPQSISGTPCGPVPSLVAIASASVPLQSRC